MDGPTFALFEHATGYALFHVTEFEDVGQMLSQVQACTADAGRFKTIVKLAAFAPFQSALNALENCNAISEGLVHPDLATFLETNVPKAKKVKVKLGVSDAKLGSVVSESLPYIQCVHFGVVPEILRGIRTHFHSIVKRLTSEGQSKAQLGLGHSYSRAKVKFNVHRVDNMIIQAIALLDQLEKDINTFFMRIREWYSYHFPELLKIVPEQGNYCRCTKYIRNRKELSEENLPELAEIVGDEKIAADILDASRSSIGMDISPVDLINIERFSDRVIALSDYRMELVDYLKARMHSCAPSLAALIGEQVGARLISKAGSLTNLAKYPASTIQILGAEKALFRALKTKGNTPKYGLLFQSQYISRASVPNKGKISRYLANKCALASRIDCFSDVPVTTFGEHLKQQMEDRLLFFETGQAQKKNIEVMHVANEEAVEKQAKILKKRKKELKKAQKLAEMEPTELMLKMEEDAVFGEKNGNYDDEGTPVKKKKKRNTSVTEEPLQVTPPKKKKKSKNKSYDE